MLYYIAPYSLSEINKFEFEFEFVFGAAPASRGPNTYERLCNMKSTSMQFMSWNSYLLPVDPTPMCDNATCCDYVDADNIW